MIWFLERNKWVDGYDVIFRFLFFIVILEVFEKLKLEENIKFLVLLVFIIENNFFDEDCIVLRLFFGYFLWFREIFFVFE